MTTIPALLKNDTCLRGHDTTDKVNSLYARHNKRTGVISYACRVCVSINQRESRVRKGRVVGSRPSNSKYHNLVNNAVTLIAIDDTHLAMLKRIAVADEIQRLKISLFVAELIGNPEPEPAE